MDAPNILKEIMDKYGIEKQTLMLAEEQGELIKAINKRLRGKTQDSNEIAEEMVDVMIVIAEIREYFGITESEIEIIVKQKMSRIVDRYRRGVL